MLDHLAQYNILYAQFNTVNFWLHNQDLKISDNWWDLSTADDEVPPRSSLTEALPPTSSVHQMLSTKNKLFSFRGFSW